MNKLSKAQIKTLELSNQRLLVVVWHAGTVYGTQGLKPWYSISGGVRGATLHDLWLEQYIRSVKPSEMYQVMGFEASSGLMIGRARLTKQGKDALSNVYEEWRRA